MSTLAQARVVLFLALMCAVSAVTTVAWDLWWALALAVVAVALGTFGWFAVEVHRSSDEWAHRVKRAAWNLDDLSGRWIQ